MTAPTILEACADPRLLATDLAPRQAEMLEGVATYRESVLAVGRRGFKSSTAALWAVYDAAFRDLTAYLRSGEARYVLCVAASREQAAIVLNFARAMLADSPLLAETVEAETADSITVRQPATGAPVTIKTVPCSARTTRGLAVSTLIGDELAHWLDATEGPQVAHRVWRALTPAVAQFREHGRLIAISTPWGRSNLFAELYERGEADPDVFALQAPTWEVNPTIPREFFDAERRRDPEMFATEYAAEFREGGGAFLDWDQIQAAVRDEPEIPPGLDLVSPVAALDPGFARDPFTLAVAGRHPVERKLRVALVRSWRPRGGELQVEDVLEEVAEICRRYRVGRVWTDQYASAPVRQSLARRGVVATELTMSATSKTTIYNNLKSKLAAGELELPPDEELLAELGRIEVRYSANSAGVHVPRRGGSHGDRAQAVAMACHGLRGAAGAHRGAFRTGRYEGGPFGARAELVSHVHERRPR